MTEPYTIAYAPHSDTIANAKLDKALLVWLSIDLLCQLSVIYTVHHRPLVSLYSSLQVHNAAATTYSYTN